MSKLKRGARLKTNEFKKIQCFAVNFFVIFLLFAVNEAAATSHCSPSTYGIPTGVDGQTIRNNGGAWVATSSLYNDGTNIGIGTVLPSSALEVQNTANSVISIDSGANRFSAVDFYESNTNKWGIGKDNVNDFYIDQFGVGRRLTINSASGNVGIGTATTNGRLDVKGLGSTSDTYGLGIRNSADQYSLIVRDDGAVGIGAIPSLGLKLDVEGKVGATAYCDENGNNCKSLTELTKTENNFFLLSNKEYNGNLLKYAKDNLGYKENDGLQAADVICLNEVNTYNWKGKPPKVFDQSEVKAFLCGGSECRTLNSNTKYTMGRLNFVTVGGYQFTTDTEGSGPNDRKVWALPDAFGTLTNYWMGRLAKDAGAPDPYSSEVWSNRVGSNCGRWTVDTPGLPRGHIGRSFAKGVFGSDNWMRWYLASEPEELGQECNINGNIICVVGDSGATTSVQSSGWVDDGSVVRLATSADIVGIGTISPSAGLKLDVEGKVGAKAYCDESGTDCISTSQLLETVSEVEPRPSTGISWVYGFTRTGIDECRLRGFGACKEEYNSLGQSTTCGAPLTFGSAICESNLLNNIIAISSIAGGVLTGGSECLSQRVGVCKQAYDSWGNLKSCDTRYNEGAVYAMCNRPSSTSKLITISSISGGVLTGGSECLSQRVGVCKQAYGSWGNLKSCDTRYNEGAVYAICEKA